MKDDTKQQLEALAQKAGVDYERVEQKFQEAIQRVTENTAAEEDEEVFEGHALAITRSDLLNFGGGRFSGEAEELPILALGAGRRKESDYFVTEGDGMVCAGIVNPPEDPAGFATFLVDADSGVSFEHVEEVFSPLNTVRGFLSRRQVGSRDGEPAIKKGGSPTYLCSSTPESKFEQVNPDEVPQDDPIWELPSEQEAKREMVHDHFITSEDEMSLQNYASHESTSNSNGYEVAFGVDVKRVRGQIIDVYSNDDGFGTMTIIDDTIGDEGDVPEELVSDRMRTPGLQVMANPAMLRYGENSLVDVYGFIEQRDDTGQYLMSGFGMVPIVEFQREYQSGGSSSDSDHEEETI